MDAMQGAVPTDIMLLDNIHVECVHIFIKSILVEGKEKCFYLKIN